MGPEPEKQETSGAPVGVETVVRCPFAIELLERERLNLRALVRTIERNEHEVMGSIPRDEYLAQIIELDGALMLLRNL